MRRTTAHIIATLMALLLAAACDFRPLHETANVSYVRIYLDEEILNVNTGFYPEVTKQGFVHPEYVRPEILRLGLFDSNTGDLKAERYLRNQGDDSRGHYFDGYIVLDPGDYDLVAYNFGTEATVLGNEYNCFGMYAYTHELSPSITSKFKSRTKDGVDVKSGEKILYDADHLFVSAAENLHTERHGNVDTLRNADGEPFFRASSVVKSYYIQIGIRGSRYLSSSVALLTGMGASSHLIDRDFESGGEATLYFELNNGTIDYYGSDVACIYGTFGTFGRLEDSDNEMLVSFEFVTTYGARMEVTFPLTDEFLKENAIVHQWLIIDKIIEIPSPGPDPAQESGGMTPSVDDWGDVESEFEI